MRVKPFQIIAAAAAIANPAYSATDKSLRTKGDMTTAEVLAIMDIREKNDALFESIYKAEKKLGNAILASTIGVVLDAAAVTVGIVKDVKSSRAEAKAEAELEKLSDKDLTARFDREFLADCEADRKKNPIKVESVGEGEAPKVATCEELKEQFASGKEKDAQKAARIQYLADKSEGDKQFSQTMNWVRTGAAAGGAIAGGVAAGVISSVLGDLDEVSKKAKDYNAALSDFNKLAMQARTEGRSNNPMMEIARCKGGVDVSKPQKALKTAKTVQIVGVVAGAGAAATSGLQNVDKIGEKKGMNVASNIASGAAAVANGVGIGLVASNRKLIGQERGKLLSCSEWLYWDDNGHAFENESGADFGYVCELTSAGDMSAECLALWHKNICPKGAELTQYGCGWCLNYSGWDPYVAEWANPGKTCEIKSCVAGFELMRTDGVVIPIGGSGDTISDFARMRCMKKCTFQNGSGYQQWYNDKILYCGKGFINGIKADGRPSITNESLVKCDAGYELFVVREEGADYAFIPLCLPINSNRVLFDDGVSFSNFCYGKSRDICEKTYEPYTDDQSPRKYISVGDYKACEKVTGSLQNAKQKLAAMMSNNGSLGIYCRKKGTADQYYVFTGNLGGGQANDTPICKWENNRCLAKSLLNVTDGTSDPDSIHECISYCNGES